MNLNDDKVNKILSEFMGWGYLKGMAFLETGGDELLKPFTKSLDSLVPVWRKYSKEIGRCVDINFFLSDTEFSDFTISNNGWDSFSCENKNSIQKAAAHATAKAIMDKK
jgi:hypothetical protein